jgi:hypothetical protein
MATASLVGLRRNRVEWAPFLSLPVDRLRTVLAVKGSLRRALNGAPWTAPGRSAETPPYKRERKAGKLVTTVPEHLVISHRDQARGTTPPTASTVRGAGCQMFSGFSSKAELFLLTSFFIEPTGRTFESDVRSQISPLRARLRSWLTADWRMLAQDLVHLKMSYHGAIPYVSIISTTVPSCGASHPLRLAVHVRLTAET